VPRVYFRRPGNPGRAELNSRSYRSFRQIEDASQNEKI